MITEVLPMPKMVPWKNGSAADQMIVSAAPRSPANSAVKFARATSVRA